VAEPSAPTESNGGVVVLGESAGVVLGMADASHHANLSSRTRHDFGT